MNWPGDYVNRIVCGEAPAVLAQIPDGVIAAACTSPPYFGLRSYGVGVDNGEIGLEKTPEAYVAHLVAVFREVRRVLADWGCVFLNLGDSYWGGKGKSGYELPHEAEERRARGETFQTGHNIPGYMEMRPTDGNHPTIKALDLCLIPFRVALALQADGWYVRSVLPWVKRNSMPESVNGWRWEQHRIKVDNEGRGQARRGQGTTAVQFQNHSGNTVYSDAKWIDCPGCAVCTPNDGLVLRRGSGRPTTSHEWIFVLAKTANYFWDAEAIRKNYETPEEQRYRPKTYPTKSVGQNPDCMPDTKPFGERFNLGGRNARTSDWFFDSLRAILDGENMLLMGEGGEPLALAVNPKGWPEAHFATYPERLIEPLIKAGTPERGCCPKCGQPWVRVVERQQESLRPKSRPVGASRGISASDFRALGQPQQGSQIVHSATLGFRPSCACGVAETTPAIVLDPFIGSGTTAVVSKKLGRRYIGIDLNPSYCQMAEKRLERILL